MQRNLSDQQCAELALAVEQAEREGFDIEKLTLAHPEMTEDDAYEIQWRSRALKDSRGQHFSGYKLGLTSRAKMRQMGVETPTYGYLANYFQCTLGQSVNTDGLIHPRVEPEIAVITCKEITAESRLQDIATAIDCVMPALEIIDSRYRNFVFDLPSVVADNSSSSRFLLGAQCKRLQDIDIETLGVVLRKNAEVVETGAGAAVLGNPLLAIAELAQLLQRRGESIAPGTLILTGALTAAVAVKPGDTVSAAFQGFGSLDCHFS